MIQNIAVRTPEKRHTTITTHRRKFKIMPAVLALQERFNFTSHAESPPLFYIHFFILRADRVIIGEVRGAETFELLSALNTGHAGSLSTAHANSVKDMISRLETMVLMGVQLPLEAIRRQIASGIEILVHLGRGEDGSRRVEEIAEITGMEEDEIKTVSLFRREYGRGLQKTGELVHREKLEGKTG